MAEALGHLRGGQPKVAIAILQPLRDELAAIDAGLGALAGSHLAEALMAAGQRARAVQVLGEDAASVRAPEYADVRARLLMQAAPIHPDPDFGLQLAAEADRLAAGLDDPAPRVHTIELLLTLLDRAGIEQGIAEVADGLCVQARRAGDRPAEVRGMLRLALHARDQGDGALALDRARQAHALASLLGEDEAALTVQAAALRGQLAARRGWLLEAVECLDQALLNGNASDEGVRLQRSLAAIGLGIEVARADAELAALAHAADAQVAHAACHALAQRRIDAGDTTGAATWWAKLPADRQKGLQARAAVRDGRPADAVRLLEALAAAEPDDPAVALQLCQALRAAGQPVAALQAADPWIDAAIEAGDLYTELRARLVRGPLQADLGDFDAARQDARRAAALATELHLPLQHVAARTQVAYALARLDLPAEAAAELDLAAEQAARVGADAAAVQAALLAALVDAQPVADALASRPVDTDAAAAGEPLLLIALAERARRRDGDPATAQRLLSQAARADTAGRFRSAIAAAQGALADLAQA